jgi:hypothetical protein
MADPDPADDWLIIESYARWAGDTLHAQELLADAEVSNPEGDTTGPQRRNRLPMSVIEWAAHRKGRERPSRRETLYQEKIADPESISEQPSDRKPVSPFFQSTNMRAVVAMVTAREFELRAYPTNLSIVDDMLRRAREAQQKFAMAGNVEVDARDASERRGAIRATGASWVMPGRLLRFVWVDAFGLVFVRGIWTPPDPIGRMGEVYNLFREVLRMLD